MPSTRQKARAEPPGLRRSGFRRSSGRAPGCAAGLALAAVVWLGSFGTASATPDPYHTVRTLLLGYDDSTYYALEVAHDYPASYFRRHESIRWLRLSDAGRRLEEVIVADVGYEDSSATGNWLRRVMTADSAVALSRLCPPGMRLAGPTRGRLEKSASATYRLSLLRLDYVCDDTLMELMSRDDLERRSSHWPERPCKTEFAIIDAYPGDRVMYLLARHDHLCATESAVSEFLIPLPYAVIGRAAMDCDRRRYPEKYNRVPPSLWKSQ